MGWSANSKKNKGNYQDIQSEYRECTCKMDKSLNRGMLNKFESRKICVTGYQCGNCDFDFCTAEHSELPVIKICSDDGRDELSTIETKRD